MEDADKQLEERKGVYFDVMVAKAYLNKMDNARKRGLTFNISLSTFKNLYRAKFCQLTGAPLTLKNKLESPQNLLTIDRINSKIGYEEGNVMAVSHAANCFKAVLEQGGILDYNSAIKFGEKLKTLKGKGKI